MTPTETQGDAYHELHPKKQSVDHIIDKNHMPNFICTTCGTQYAESDQPPLECIICQEERQYVKVTGQNWTTLDRLRLTNRNSIKAKEPGLIGIGIDPPFAIGQRALFLRTP